MWVPWQSREGPEYAASLEKARQQADDLDRLEQNLTACRFALKRDPQGLSHAFLEERDDLRVFSTTDIAAGYEMVVFFEILAAYSIELKWIELRHLA